MTIGRSVYSSIIIDDPTVSREHAELQVKDDILMLIDLDSSNGVLVNNKRVDSCCILIVRDLIKIGPSVLEVGAIDLSISELTMQTPPHPTEKL